MRRELVGLNGGKKQFWLRLHRKEVEEFYFKHGPEATMKEFCLRPATLERFFDRKGHEERATRLSENDRWVLRMANEGIRDVKRHLRQLEEWKEEVQPVIDVGQSLINATMAKIRQQSGYPTLSKDPLRIANLGGKSEK